MRVRRRVSVVVVRRFWGDGLGRAQVGVLEGVGEVVREWEEG